MSHTSASLVPLFKVMIGGAPITPEEADNVQEIKVSGHVRLPDVCTVAVRYPEVGGLDNSAFKIGASLEVRLGATADSTTDQLFIGEILTLAPSFGEGGIRMMVRAYDRSHRMMRARKSKVYSKQTIGEIVQQVCSKNGLSLKILKTTPGGRLDHVIQHNETDWDFVWRLMNRIGFEFLVNHTNATIGPPGDGSPEVELDLDKNQLLTFQPRVTAVQQVQQVVVQGFDHGAKDKLVATAASPNLVTQNGIDRDTFKKSFGTADIKVVGQSFRTQGEGQAIAQAQLDQLANSYVAAVGTTHGNPDIKAGVKLKIKGVGANFSGTYRAARVEHVIRSGGAYSTKFYNSVGEHTLAGQAGGNGSSALDSLVVGIVTNNNDPQKMGRVKLKLPVLHDAADGDQESFWVPVAVPSAGNERGLSMLPQVGEQVIVGFENGDTSYPYVLGSLFNGRDKPGEEMAVQDGSFSLKSDQKALIAAKKDITLRSDGGKWIIQINGGEVTEDVKAGQGGQGGYTGNFDGAYKLTAKQAITIESNMKVEIKAPMISIEATGPLQLKGNPVQIDGQSMVTVSGAMINLG